MRLANFALHSLFFQYSCWSCCPCRLLCFPMTDDQKRSDLRGPYKLARKCLAAKKKNTLFEKSNFCPKFNFDKTVQFSQEIKVKQLKSPKPKHFHEFSPKTIRHFFWEIKVKFFWTKIEDFEQCEKEVM